jgi:hypothetical protein
MKTHQTQDQQPTYSELRQQLADAENRIAEAMQQWKNWEGLRDAEKLRADNAEKCVLGMRELVERISKQKPEKPDYWSSCGQCDRNIDDAQEALSTSPAELSKRWVAREMLEKCVAIMLQVTDERKEADILCADGFTMSFHRGSNIHRWLLEALTAAQAELAKGETK